MDMATRKRQPNNNNNGGEGQKKKKPDETSKNHHDDNEVRIEYRIAQFCFEIIKMLVIIVIMCQLGIQAFIYLKASFTQIVNFSTNILGYIFIRVCWQDKTLQHNTAHLLYACNACACSSQHTCVFSVWQTTNTCASQHACILVASYLVHSPVLCTNNKNLPPVFIHLCT